MMKKTVILALMLSMVANAFAVDTKIGDLWYRLSTDANEATVIKYKNNVKYRGDIVIPETVEYGGTSYNVTGIGAQAFESCTTLSSVTIPNSVTSIEWCAFFSCSGLTSITIPNGGYIDCKRQRTNGGKHSANCYGNMFQPLLHKVQRYE